MAFWFKNLRDKSKMTNSLTFILFFCALFGFKVAKSQGISRDSIKTTTLVAYIDSLHAKKPNLAYKFCDSIIKNTRYGNNNIALACAYKGIAIYHFGRKEFEQAQLYFYKAIALFEPLNLYIQINQCHSYIGECLTNKGDINGAIKQFKLALDLYTKAGNIAKVGYTNNELGQLYETKGDFEKSVEYSFNALRNFTAVDNNAGKALMYNNIGNSFNILGIYETAEEYLLKSIKLASDGGDASIECLANETLGTNYLQSEQLKKGLYHLERSVSLIDKPFTLGTRTVVYIYISAANAYLLNNNIPKALFNLKKAKQLNIDSANTYENGFFAIVKGRLDFLRGNYVDAEEELKVALRYATLLESLPLKIESLIELRKIYAKTGRYKLSYETQNEIIRINNKLDKNGISKKIAIYLLNSKFEKKEKEQELAKKEEQELLKSKIRFKNLILISMLFIIFSISTLVAIYYKNHKKQKALTVLLQQKNDLVETKNSEIGIQKELLLKANQTKDLIFTILAHDLRNPLSQIQMTLGLMENDDLSKSEFDELLPLLSEGVRTTSDTLDSLLYWAKTQMNGFKLNLENHNLYNFIVSEIQNNKSLLSKKEISLTTNIPFDLIISLDTNLIKIIFRNLLNNAVKFSETGGKIEVNHHQDYNYHYLSIKDFGVGMSLEQIHKLFSNFTNSTLGTKNEKGLGVGLIFCKDLIEKSDGNITVISNLNEGSTFTFSILKKLKPSA